VAALGCEAPHAAHRQRRQLCVGGIVADRFPVGQLRVADHVHPFVGHLADQVGRCRAAQASAVRPAHRELDDEIAFAGMPTRDAQAGREVRSDHDRGFHRRHRRRNGRDTA
jgi:hypothetical protein